MASGIVPHKTHARKGDRFLFSSSDDNVMLKQIESTHAPDDPDFALKPILQVVEDVFHRATSAVPGIVLVGCPQLDALDDTLLPSGLDDILDILARTIFKISCELSSKSCGGGDAHSTTIAILGILTNYNWDAKLVLSLAGFAVIYGEFWLDTQLYPTNMLAKGVGLLKQLPGMMEHTDALKPKLEAVTKLIRAMLDVTKCIVQFKELPDQYLAHSSEDFRVATVQIPMAVYWTIRSAVACALQIVGLIGMGHEYIPSTQETWECLSLTRKLTHIHEHHTAQLAKCHKLIGERQHAETYQALEHLFTMPHIDNTKLLAALMYDETPLYDGSSKQRVGINVLKRKLILLLISDLDIHHDEIQILQHMYNESRQNPIRPDSQYEMLWLPIVDRSTQWTDEKETQFKTLQNMMLWYSVHHPSLIDPAVVKYVKDDWQFNQKPMLVVLDQQGKVVNENAMHMMWIWGGILAFPFTSEREEELWRSESWRMDLPADNLEPAIFTWLEKNKYVCLYGGEDIEWIRRLTTTVNAVANEAKTPLEMLYVGTSSQRERIRKNMFIIQSEKLSYTLSDPALIWFFWVRLESMWHSRTKYSKKHALDHNDPIMQEIMKMLTFDSTNEGWALFCGLSAEMAKAKGDTMVRCFDEYPSWRDLVDQKGFVGAINDHVREIQPPHHCNCLVLPSTTRGIPERVVCAECGRTMERFIMYQCCTD